MKNTNEMSAVKGILMSDFTKGMLMSDFAKGMLLSEAIKGMLLSDAHGNRGIMIAD